MMAAEPNSRKTAQFDVRIYRLMQRASVPHDASMKKKPNETRPGELFIDRYMPSATEEAREEAYANLRALVALLVRIDERLALEAQEEVDSRES